MTTEFINALTEIVGKGAVRFDEPMSLHTTFRIGGPADLFVIPPDEQSLVKAVECCKQWEIPWMIIGNGSNLLVGDKGIRGVVFQIFQTMDQVSFERLDGCQVRVQAGAGILLSRLSRLIAGEGLEGFEFASGIPGTFGGAVTMNAGAYGGEMGPLMDFVKVLTVRGELLFLKKEDLAMGYRTSIIQREQMIVLEASMLLCYGEPGDIKARIEDFSLRRREKQPLEYPSAGSTFKRPEGYFAGKLIQDAGLKGCRVGGAQVSEKHSGFVINTGSATAKDVLELIRYIQTVVQEKFNVCLEPEVRIVGEF
ncbi:UDP-N-acetylmuramate dehydrogenase [Catenibacillus scindens]|uniref:UDP-N-acetylenolpyruvoylglucosamine reductase n=1 Tax=Catenibacillus scindens TaxID=673271 RepID=A0A7W8H7D9_9FIRM|nr:UDP-N-acetylmuramate dehydrogenase [Catenibacillus scindens]MBB5262995.1 UDP-N-acetylmuramate dehydrogenase [Catenibacillus scindens]